jgi:hypothetical protein
MEIAISKKTNQLFSSLLIVAQELYKKDFTAM